MDVRLFQKCLINTIKLSRTIKKVRKENTGIKLFNVNDNNVLELYNRLNDILEVKNNRLNLYVKNNDYYKYILNAWTYPGFTRQSNLIMTRHLQNIISFIIAYIIYKSKTPNKHAKIMASVLTLEFIVSIYMTLRYSAKVVRKYDGVNPAQIILGKDVNVFITDPFLQIMAKRRDGHEMLAGIICHELGHWTYATYFSNTLHNIMFKHAFLHFISSKLRNMNIQYILTFMLTILVYITIVNVPSIMCESYADKFAFKAGFGNGLVNALECVKKDINVTRHIGDILFSWLNGYPSIHNRISVLRNQTDKTIMSLYKLQTMVFKL